MNTTSSIQAGLGWSWSWLGLVLVAPRFVMFCLFFLCVPGPAGYGPLGAGEWARALCLIITSQINSSKKTRGWSRLVPSGTGRDFRAGIHIPSRDHRSRDSRDFDAYVAQQGSQAHRGCSSQQRDAMLKNLNNFLFYYRSTLLNG